MKRVSILLSLAVLVAVAAAGMVAAPAAAHGPGGWFGRGGPDTERGALLATELGISVEQLQAAHLRAMEKGLAQAVTDGRLTQAQADLMLATAKVHQGLDRDALLAATLGISVAELTAAREAGKTPHELMSELGLDRQTMAANAKAAMDQAIDQAVKDGRISQTQAEALKAAANSGLGRGFGRGLGLGRGMGRGPSIQEGSRFQFRIPSTGDNL